MRSCPDTDIDPINIRPLEFWRRFAKNKKLIHRDFFDRFSSRMSKEAGFARNGTQQNIPLILRSFQ